MIMQKACDVAGMYIRTRSRKDKLSRRFLSKIFDESQVELLFRMFKVITVSFGENWDFDVTKMQASFRGKALDSTDEYRPGIHNIIISEFRFLLHFPEITIKNEKGNSIDIEDLFIAIPFSSENNSIKFLGQIFGCRTTLSHGQWSSQYHHSHLRSVSSANIPTFSRFCTGNSSLQNTMSRLATSHKLDLVTFKMLILQAKQLAGTESLDGGPHMLMSRVSESSYINLRPCLPHYSRSVFTAVLPKLINKSVDMVIENNKIVVIPNDKLKKIITDITNNNNHYCYKIGNDYYSLGRSNSSITPSSRIQNKDMFWYKGELIKYTIKPPNNLEGQVPEKVIHPDIVKYVQKNLSARATRNYHNSFITSEGFKYSATSPNDKPLLRSSNAPLLQD